MTKIQIRIAATFVVGAMLLFTGLGLALYTTGTERSIGMIKGFMYTGTFLLCASTLFSVFFPIKK